MKKSIKIYGAGSIGNHLSNAAINLGFNVDVFEKDKNALDRMKNKIFPSRYGKWNNDINLFMNSDTFDKDYELICIGTPPDTHLELLYSSLQNYKCPIMVEKPLCEPSHSSIKKLKSLSEKEVKRIFVGYNHVVSKASQLLEEIVKKPNFGEILSLDVEFRENWKGIFDAHPWLSGPEESYLGNIDTGGGSSGEHSHALNLWQHFSRVLDLGKTKKVMAKYDFIKEKKLNYDKKSYFLIETDTNFKGSVTQDVVTYPASKKVKIQGSNLYAEWICNYSNNDDMIFVIDKKNNKKETLIKKSRSDDFIEELKHILNFKSFNKPSPINLVYGINTMETLIAACKSSATGSEIKI